MNNYTVLYSINKIEQPPISWFSESSPDVVNTELMSWIKNRNPGATIKIISITKVIFN